MPSVDTAMANRGLQSYVAVQYSCDTCGITGAVVHVDRRTDDDWDAFMVAVTTEMEADHVSKTPDCTGPLTHVYVGVNPGV